MFHILISYSSNESWGFLKNFCHFLGKIMSSASSSIIQGISLPNLERFLLSVTPDVPSRTLHLQSCSGDLNRQWLPPGKDAIEYFTLEDLWDCYNEWSAYGAGTTLMLESGDTLTQYHVPYLSAIQIYSGKSVEFENDSLSEDSGSDNLSRSLSNNSSKAWDTVSLDSSCDQGGSWPTKDMLGYLYLQYIETSPPCWRVPFAEKIPELAISHPALMTLKSVDISPASWMAVAWYPIYPIPSQKNGKDLGASFLTYHTLSSSFQEEKCEKENSGCISLSPFGLATYKMRKDIWLSPSSDNQKVLDLYSAADSWLKQLHTHHHDFNFFTLKSTL